MKNRTLGILLSVMLVLSLCATAYAVVKNVSVVPKVENEEWIMETDRDTDSASSMEYDCNCRKYDCDENGQNCSTVCDTCYTRETARCNASVTCDSDSQSCTASGGGSCSVSCNAEAYYVNYDLRYSHEGMNDVVEHKNHACQITIAPKTFQIDVD